MSKSKPRPKRHPERQATRSGLSWQCPRCGGSSCRSRRSTPEYLLSLVGVIPRRCEGCSHRFYVHILTRSRTAPPRKSGGTPNPS